MIKIITTSNCPYCIMAKNLLSSLGFKYEEINLTNDDNKLMEIISISGMRTVPQIFNGEVKKSNLLGGYSDIKALHDKGKLIPLLQK